MRFARCSLFIAIAVAVMDVTVPSVPGKPFANEPPIQGTWILKRGDKLAAMLKKSLGKYYVGLTFNADSTCEVVGYPRLTKSMHEANLNTWVGSYIVKGRVVTISASDDGNKFRYTPLKFSRDLEELSFSDHTGKLMHTFVKHN